MNRKLWWSWLQKTGACSDAIEWCQTQKSSKQAWTNCERGDWMLWILGRKAGKQGSAKRRKLVLAACECARLSLKYISKKEKRPLIAIETAEKWARREKGVSIDDVRNAAAASAASSYASSAASAAASAAYYAASSAAYYAASAAAASAASSSKQDVLKKCADIVRKNYSNPPRQV